MGKNKNKNEVIRMSVKEKLINDIKLLPDHTLQAISIIVEEIVMLNGKENNFDLPYKRGCMKGKMWMSDDFDEPLEDF